MNKETEKATIQQEIADDVVCIDNCTTSIDSNETTGREYSDSHTSRLENSFEKDKTSIQNEKQNFHTDFHTTSLMLANSRNNDNPP